MAIPDFSVRGVLGYAKFIEKVYSFTYKNSNATGEALRCQSRDEHLVL